VAGNDHRDEGEMISRSGRSSVAFPGGDRLSLALKDEEQQMIRAAAEENGRTVVVLVGGSAILVEGWEDRVPAVLMGWYSGMEGGSALARLLFGEVSPSGKLPFTVPKHEAQLPFFDPAADSIAYGPYHGYTLFDREETEPAYPFGFGLSYTTFAYDRLRLQLPELSGESATEVLVDVTNTGTRAGDEVVQLYVGFSRSTVERPVKLLRGFRKVTLAPGQTETVRFPLSTSDLAYFDPETASWRVEPADYDVFAGSSSRSTDLLSTMLRVR
jgi:beta-glucosidase